MWGREVWRRYWVGRCGVRREGGPREGGGVEAGFGGGGGTGVTKGVRTGRVTLEKNCLYLQ